MLVERSVESAALDGRLSACFEGQGGVLLASGPVATGKTTLLGSFAERATAAGALVLHATGSSFEHPLPFGIMDQLIRSAEALGDLGARMSGQLPELTTPVDDRANVAICQTISTMLLERTELRPIVAIVDDVNHSDAPSLECLLALARRMKRAKLMLLLCGRPGRAQRLFQAKIMRVSPFQRIQLHPFSRAGVVSLIADQLGQGAADLLADEWYEITGGNPLLISALIEGRSTGDGSAFIEMFLSRLYVCDPDLLSLVRGLAALGEPASRVLLAELLDLDLETVVQLVRELEETGFLHRGRLRHASIRMAILDDMSTGERALIRSRAAVIQRCGMGKETVSSVLARVPTVPIERSDRGGADRLSEAERRVALLAAQDHSNQQIAELLFVTVSTVEQHLTRVYRKLDLRRRTDLARRLHTSLEYSA